jgi:membrane protein implicated in regulation of membrane protease activity
MSPWLWALLGVLALAGESVSMALFLLYVGVAAFVAALLALLHVGLAAQVGVFVALSLLLIVLVRPRMLQALSGRVPHRALTNQGLLIDRLATVTQTVTRDGGTIRVGNAEFWSARANPPLQQIEVGSQVRIAYVDGLTAYVEPVAVARAADRIDAVIPEAPLAPGASPTRDMAREDA